jgi:tocopherol O-methyltransferase
MEGERHPASSRRLLEEWASTEAVRRHYDRLSAYYHALWGEHIHHGYWEGEAAPDVAQVRLTERLAERARIRPGSRVLDVGCGLGGSSRWLARQLGCSVLGITVSPVQADIAARLTREQGLAGRVDFQVMDACQLPQLGERFDAVWVIECSEHLADKERFIQDCAQTLRPGGTLALCAWTAAAEPSPEQLRLIWAICRGMCCPSLANQAEYVGWMQQAGLVDVVAEEIGARVQHTWSRCSELVQRPWVQGLLRVTDPATREFVATFSLMRQAFSSGALGYGMITAHLAPNGAGQPE